MSLNPYQYSWIKNAQLPMLTSIQSAGVTPEVSLRNRLRAGEKARKRGNPLWLWNSGQTSPEVKNRGISGPTKRTCVLHFDFSKQKHLKYVCTFNRVIHSSFSYFWSGIQWIHWIGVKYLIKLIFSSFMECPLLSDVPLKFNCIQTKIKFFPKWGSFCRFCRSLKFKFTKGGAR